MVATVALHAIGIALGMLSRPALVLRTAGSAIAVAGLVLIVAH